MCSTLSATKKVAALPSAAFVALVALAGEARKACGFSRYAERGQDLGQ
jgi:hypothetical protein